MCRVVLRWSNAKIVTLGHCREGSSLSPLGWQVRHRPQTMNTESWGSSVSQGCLWGPWATGRIAPFLHCVCPTAQPGTRPRGDCPWRPAGHSSIAVLKSEPSSAGAGVGDRGPPPLAPPHAGGFLLLRN